MEPLREGYVPWNLFGLPFFSQSDDTTAFLFHGTSVCNSVHFVCFFVFCFIFARKKEHDVESQCKGQKEVDREITAHCEE